nr:4285_t:CDS:2 [Entrophospora candida]
MNLISTEEVAKHNKREDCWVIIHSKVYDLTNFLPDHPGGIKVILDQAGKDATEVFEPIHPPDIIDQYLKPESYVGIIDPSNLEKTFSQNSEMDKRRELAIQNKPHLSEMLNLFDFEAVAQQVLKPESWIYFSSGANDEISLRENHNAFHRIWIKPRVMRNVMNIDTSTTLLGHHSSFPVYITAAALGKLAHPEGEVILTRAAYQHQIIQMLATLASCSLDEMTNATGKDQVQFYQLYINKNRTISRNIIKKVEEKGCKALFINVDTPQLGYREKSMRAIYMDPNIDEKTLNSKYGSAKAISLFIDASLNWNDIEWLKSITTMPIVLKGIQTAEDAVLAAKYGCAGIVLSNHGGRQLDFARSAIEILPEVVLALKKENLLDKIEIYIDGGIRRGTDIFKAIALGAKAVGIGRPMLYAMSSYGQEGVEKALKLLKEEFEMVMRLAGVTSLKEIGPDFVDSKNLNNHISVPKSYLFSNL